MKYLYNGVKLPALPEWDKRKYPYAFIVASGTWTYLWVCTMPFYIGSENGYDIASADGEIASCILGYSGDRWSSTFTTYTFEKGDSLYQTTQYLKWANYDFLYDNGTLYLAASYPVNAETGEEIKDYAPTPILAPTIDPLSLFLGWKAGNWVARQRGRKAEEEKTPCGVSV